MKLHCGGDERAFEVLADRYRVELFHYLARLVNNKASADDLFQETFLQVHLSADRFDTSRRFRPWLFTIATNKARDLLRKNNMRSTVSLARPVSADDDQERDLIDFMEVKVPQPDESLEQAEIAERVRGVVDGLPSHLRETLLLAYFHQFSYQQIAEMLQIPIGTVKSRLHTAVGTFATRWAQRSEKEDRRTKRGKGL